jgi:hypothetical protein
MAISYKDKLIFVHIPKCAGTSIEKALSRVAKLELMNPNPIEDNRIQKQSLNRVGYIHRLERHLSAIEIRNIVGDIFFEKAFKFSFVRNPYSRLVSFYNYILKQKYPDRNKLQVNLVLVSLQGFMKN